MGYAEHPMIEIDEDGKLKRIHFNERARASWAQWRPTDDLDATHKFYQALSEFERLIENTEQHLNLTLQPGEMIVVDNWRALHSRDGFEGPRWMEGGYITWEQVRSLWRMCGEHS